MTRPLRWIGVKTPKPDTIWTSEEEKLASGNSKVPNAIFCGVDDQDLEKHD
ncbi:hypothetical protein J1N35_033240 [Gossypium stocksii]|uniref:Uncharacterized protein n=1 Tax=Gossypium stocksii TaxID=47602 RepID=A0A9D3UQ94_9ROSI|nr:hypothetical protein J1N35_033240 [Gossypium stocksii]